jgi:hypothetical protein
LVTRYQLNLNITTETSIRRLWLKNTNLYGTKG